MHTQSGFKKPFFIAITATLLLIGAWVSVTSLLKGKDSVLWERLSSDGVWQATGFLRSWKSGGTFRTLVSIGKREAGFGESSHVVFAADGRIQASACWAGDRKLIIQYSANKTFKRETTWCGVGIAYQEVP